jgi:exodeoxyribonuclease-3
MKFLSLNCNGYRSAVKKGLTDLITKENPDVFCLQEIKASKEDMQSEFWKSKGYDSIINPATKPGYSGTAIFSRLPILKSEIGIGDLSLDQEGRSILCVTKGFAIENSYYPSGTSGDARQDEKYRFLNLYKSRVKKLMKKHSKLILCGDVNIAHKEIDIHNPKGNLKNSGFLPEERAWLDDFLNLGLVDSFRAFQGEVKDQYSWWTYRFQSKKKNKGWRIDYFFVSEILRQKIISAKILQEWDLSDHAPLTLEINL